MRFIINDEDLFVSHKLVLRCSLLFFLRFYRVEGPFGRRGAFVEPYPCIVAAIIIVQIVDKGSFHTIPK